MLVLNNPTRLGRTLLTCFAILLIHSVFTASVFTASVFEICYAVEPTETSPVKEAVIRGESAADLDNPPLLDFSDLLLELDELPALDQVFDPTLGTPTCESSQAGSAIELTSGPSDEASTDQTLPSTSKKSSRSNPLRSANEPKGETPKATVVHSSDSPLLGVSIENELPEQSPQATPSIPSPGTIANVLKSEDTTSKPIGSAKTALQLPDDPPTLSTDYASKPAWRPFGEGSPEDFRLPDPPDEDLEVVADMPELERVPLDTVEPKSMDQNSQADASPGRETHVAEQPAESENASLRSKSVTTPNVQGDASRSKPKPRVVTLKKLTDDDQESPRLDKVPRENDAKQSRDEDVAAVEAKRPQASKKSFIESNNSAKTIASKGLSEAEILRLQRVESCLAYYIANPETVVERSPWAVMHAMLPFGVEGEVIVGNKRVNSIQWMCNNGTCRTQKIFTPSGRTFRPNVGGGVQGHEGQFLAMLAQSQVSADYPIVVNNKRFSVLDLVRYEMATCREKSELTFKLISLSYYVDTAQSWTAADRRKWNIGKLVEQELAQPVIGAACGGTHRLMGLTFAVRQRKAEGRPIDGQFARAEKYVADYVDYTWTLQNPDGSFSSNWFESRGHEQNKERLVQTTGHILEWLIFTLPKDKLDDPRVLKSVDFLLKNIWDDRKHKWPIGPRGHATRAIALYQQRTYGVQPGQRHAEMAAKIDSLKLRR